VKGVAMPMIENWKLVVLERYAKFDGRAGRAEFWWYVLANVVLYVAASLLISIGFAIATAIGVIVVVLAGGLYLALLIPSIAVAIRRLHDTDKSGWFLLLGLIPFVGFIILLVFYAQEGTPGPNMFGAGPEPAAG
jgi:uncharacterized membrane protein YhaH (DUF805 family)